MDYERNLHSHIVCQAFTNEFRVRCLLNKINIHMRLKLLSWSQAQVTVLIDIERKKNFWYVKNLHFFVGVTLKEVCFHNTFFAFKYLHEKCDEKTYFDLRLTDITIDGCLEYKHVQNMKDYSRVLSLTKSRRYGHTLNFRLILLEFLSIFFLLWFLWTYRHGMHWWQTACKWQQ